MIVEGAGELASWRGSYDQLTVTRPGPARTAGEMLDDAKAALHKTFEGYKGGDYRMTESTRVWADDWGCYNQNALDGISLNGRGAFLITRYVGD